LLPNKPVLNERIPPLETTKQKTMTTEKNKQIRALFDKLDTNGDGVLDLNDYNRSYRSKEEFAKQLGFDDLNGDGKINFQEFYRAFDSVKESTDTFYQEDGLVKWLAVFQHYDLDGSGYLELGELREIFVKKGIMNEAEIVALMNEMDVVEQDGRISLTEFILYHLREEEPAKEEDYRPGQIISKKA
jgi:calcium-dependent protein kinase